MSFNRGSGYAPMISNRSLVSIGENRLSIIAEDGYEAPATPKPPARILPLPHRFIRRHNIEPSPRYLAEKSPPPYSAGILSRNEKLVHVKRRSCLPERGGWKRLTAIALVLIAVLVALVVGLVVGLRKHEQNR